MEEYRNNFEGYFQRYALPILVAILICLFYYIIVKTYDLDMNDLYSLILFCITAVPFIQYSLKGPALKIPYLWIDFEQIDSKPKPPIKIDEFISKDSFVVYNSLEFVYLSLIGLVTTPYVVYLLFKAGLFATAFCLTLLEVVLLVIAYKIYTDKFPKLVINKEGIATQLSGFILWEEIEKITIQNINSSEYNSKILKIFLKENENNKEINYTLDVSKFTKSRKIKGKIEEFSNIKVLEF